jgi:hypothetical protein
MGAGRNGQSDDPNPPAASPPLHPSPWQEQGAHGALPKEARLSPITYPFEKQKQKRKDATTQELLARTLGLLEENTEFDDNVLASFNDKFKTSLSPRSITMLDSLVKKMEKVKKPKERKVAAKKKATDIT